MKRAVIILLGWMVSALAPAHELRPAYLELREDRPGEFSVLWKTPMRGDMRLSLAPGFGGRMENLSPVITRETGGASIQAWRLRALEPLRGQSLRIDGLEGTMTDALVRVEFADGKTWTHRFTPQQPEARIPASQGGRAVAGEYLRLGVEHILLGVDHLLFVLALLIITPGAWRLVKTITAFTVAHSLTLALATLGFVHVPQTPVEAVIALSIVFVASEILRLRTPSPASAGEGRGEGSLATRAPWLIALVFGLLHGLGFAGALGEIGLPQGHIPMALLFFNLGVELGQLLFIGAVLSLAAVTRRITRQPPRWASLIAPYAIGSTAMFWVMQRVAAF
jgi:hydrogenase/urease accessory protein HupE